MKQNKVIKSDALLKLEQLVDSRIDIEHTEIIDAFLKEYVYLFTQLAPNRLYGDRDKYFKKYNLINPVDFLDKVNYIKCILGEDNYEYINDSKFEFTPEIVTNIFDMFEKNDKSFILFKKTGNYKELSSLFIRISNSFNHNNYIFINDRLFMWNQHGGKLFALFHLRIADFESIVKCIESCCVNTA